MGTIELAPGASPKYRPPEPITEDHEAATFDCGKAALNDFLRQRALKNEGRASRTYVVVSARGSDRGEIAAFYSLTVGAVQRQDMPSNMRRNMPNPAPVMVLGRMAVGLPHRGTGLGKGMLRDALRRFAEATQRVGAVAIIVHAIDDEAITFYTQFGFQEFPTGSRTLFLPTGTLLQAVSRPRPGAVND